MLGQLTKYDRKRIILEKAIKIAGENDYKNEHCRALISLGILYLDLGNIDRALNSLEQAESKARQIGNKSKISRSLHHIGRCLLERNEYREAIEKFEEAYNVLPTPKNHLENFISLGISYSTLSRLEPKIDDYFNKSKSYFERGLKLAEEQHLPQKAFVCLSHLGYMYVRHKISDNNSSQYLDMAIKYLDAASTKAATCAEKRFLFQSYSNYFLRKFLISENTDHKEAALTEAEKWLEKTEDCYEQMWRDNKQDIDKITWSDQCEFVSLIRVIQEIKWLSGKKLEALIMAERFRSRSLKDTMLIRHQTTKEIRSTNCLF